MWTRQRANITCILRFLMWLVTHPSTPHVLNGWHLLIWQEQDSLLEQRHCSEQPGWRLKLLISRTLASDPHLGCILEAWGTTVMEEGIWSCIHIYGWAVYAPFLLKNSHYFTHNSLLSIQRLCFFALETPKIRKTINVHYLQVWYIGLIPHLRTSRVMRRQLKEKGYSNV